MNSGTSAPRHSHIVNDHTPILLGTLALILICGGSSLYLFQKNIQINAVPWIIWSTASFFAFLHSYLSDKWSPQTALYLCSGVIQSTIVLKHFRNCNWKTVPKWQTRMLPILLLSPLASYFVSPLHGILLQIGFSWVTTSAFIQTAWAGKSRDSLLGWVVGWIGMSLLLLANPFTSDSYLLPFNGILIYSAGILAILHGRTLQHKLDKT